MTKIKPEANGSPIVNIICSECGGYFSERQGHTCGNDEWYY